MIVARTDIDRTGLHPHGRQPAWQNVRPRGYGEHRRSAGEVEPLFGDKLRGPDADDLLVQKLPMIGGLAYRKVPRDQDIVVFGEIRRGKRCDKIDGCVAGRV